MRQTSLTLTTVNVNGLRAATRKGFVEWLAVTDADVVALQETRADPEQLPASVAEPDGWHVVHAPSSARGRNGVALYSRLPPESIRIGFGEPEFDRAGRYVEIDLPELTVASLYLPSGDVGTPRQEEKFRFMAGFLSYLRERREKSAVDGREVAICGDWNIAHQESDLKNWRANRKRSGFLPEERAWLSQVFDEVGYVDTTRAVHPHGPGPYTWWSYRGKAFDNDSGWRIDYVVTTPALAVRARTAVVERAERYDLRWSDHAPVTVTFAPDPESVSRRLS